MGSELWIAMEHISASVLCLDAKGLCGWGWSPGTWVSPHWTSFSFRTLIWRWLSLNVWRKFAYHHIHTHQMMPEHTHICLIKGEFRSLPTWNSMRCPNHTSDITDIQGSVGEGWTLSKIIAYPEVAQFHIDEGPYEGDCLREMWGCDEGVHGKRGVHANGHVRKVLGIMVSWKGQCAWFSWCEWKERS